MYLLIFEAWAKLCGFTLRGDMTMGWNSYSILAANGSSIYTYNQLASQILTMEDGRNYEAMNNALMLANIMTHASLILIFVFIIMFFVFIFRLVSGMLSGRR